MEKELVSQYEKVLNHLDDSSLKAMQEELNSQEVFELLSDECKLNDFTDNCIKFVNKLSKIPFVGDLAVDVNLFANMVLDSIKGKYKLSKLSKSVITATLLYVITPIDLIPDFIPMIGYIDDIAVMRIAKKYLSEELYHYKLYIKNLKNEAFNEAYEKVIADRFYQSYNPTNNNMKEGEQQWMN